MEDNVKKRHPIRNLFILVVFIVIIGWIVYGIWDYSNRRYEKVIDKYISSYIFLGEEDVEEILDLMPASYKKYVLNEAANEIGALDESEFVEFIVKCGYSLQDKLNLDDDCTYNYEIVNEEEYISIETRNLVNEAKSNGIEFDGEVDKAISTTIEFYDCNSDNKEITMNIMMLNINGKWYIGTADALKCNGFYAENIGNTKPETINRNNSSEYDEEDSDDVYKNTNNYYNYN